ncbi:MAG: transposase [Patescibacteria group bacterium]|nr:transposase [Patescibacteria group bacterium]
MSPYKKYKSMRLPHYDYSSEGYYFITICTKQKTNIFGKILENKMSLNKYGKIVKRQWQWLEKQYSYISLDKYIIMPNHFHGIIIIDSSCVGTGRDTKINKYPCVDAGRDPHLRGIKIKPITEIIGAFKTTSSKLIHQNGFPEFRWQRSFYDRIIDNEKSLDNVREYIILNPSKWNLDRNNPKNY